MNVDVQAMARRLQESLGTVIVGKEAEIELCIVGLLCRGHLLIEDVPGTGKTLLAKALARSSGCSFERVQFTPDLLPGDVTGVSVYNPQDQTFEFRQGPIFAQVLLADEINRATPKTQSALLEAMEEWQVTVDGPASPPGSIHGACDPEPHRAGRDVSAPGGAGRPIPSQAATRIPAADRGGRDARSLPVGSPLGTLVAVTDAAEIKAAQAVCRDIYCDAALKDYCVRIVRRTRDHRDVSLGSSPRGTLGLLHAGQARAALAGREFVLPDDIKEIAANVLEHRVMLRPNAELRGLTAASVLEEVLATESVPMTGRRLA